MRGTNLRNSLNFHLFATALLAMFAAAASGCGQAAPANNGKANALGGAKDTQMTTEEDTGDPVTDEDTAVPDDPDAVAVTTDAQGTGDLPVAGTDAPAPADDAGAPGPDIKKGPKCIDEDGDGYGVNCGVGKEDCDDLNPNFNTVCADCTKGNVPGCNCSGKSVACFTGDPTWNGKGICTSGVQACVAGFWDECKGQILPGLEVCDGQDNDCDGQVDEGVKSKCNNCDMSCNQQSVGPKAGGDFELTDQNSTGVGLDKDGNITLDPSQISLNLKFIWVANSSEATVSKVDCKTVTEVGRFQVCPSPSRTAVDLDGNVWVACRGDGGVAKIMAEKKNCVDQNKNGVIDTSSNNQTICNTPGCDECVKFLVHPEGQLGYPGARGAAVDKFNHVWIGYYSMAKVDRLEPIAGNKLEQIDLQGCSPYGLVLDQKGILWAQGVGCGNLVRVDVNAKQITKYKPPNGGYGAYGINVDKYERIWLGGSWNIGGQGGGAARFDPVANDWKVSAGCPGSSAIATSTDGFTYVANDGQSAIGKIDSLDTTYKGAMSLMGGILGNQYRGPHGVALDYDGYVWGVNLGSSSVGKIDPKTMQLVGEIKVGSGPYTYSDMTGYTLNYFTAPKGQYVATFFGNGVNSNVAAGANKNDWQSYSVDADTPENTSLKVRIRCADDAGALTNAVWSDGVDFPPETFPYDIVAKGGKCTGLLMQVEVTLSTKDKKISPVVKSVTAKSKLN